MEDTTTEDQDSLTPDGDDTPTTSAEEIAAVRKEAELAKNYKIRAEKAESEAKQLRREPKPVEPSVEVNQPLSAKDVAFLAKNVHEDDYDDLTKWAEFEKLSLSEAHKKYKPLLDAREETRRTAAATQVGKQSRGTSKVTGEDLLEKAEKTGEMPEDEESLNKIFLAKQARRMKDAQH